MAKLTNQPGIGGERTQALGPAYRVSMWRGIPRVYAKAQNRRKKISARQQQAMDDFRDLALVPKWITGREQAMAIAMSEGTQYLWRDLVYMATAGRLWRWQDENGKWWFSVAARTTQSDGLDAISQIPGTMLWRGPNWWDVIEPGDEGQVLTFHDDQTAPTWETPTGGGGSVNSLTVGRSSNYSVPSGNNAVPWNVQHLADWPGWDVSTPTRIELPAAATRFRFFCQVADNGYSVGGTNSNLLELYDADTGAALAPRLFLQPTIASDNTRTWQLGSGWMPRGSVDALQFMRWPTYAGTILMNSNSYLTIEVDAV